VTVLCEVVITAPDEHPYEVPGISARPIIAGNPDYLQWMLDETSGPRASQVDEA
jgi:periplasmic divalent cation tolerance protein